MLREICAHIAKVVYVSVVSIVCVPSEFAISNEVWPEAKFAAVGAFIFLRSVRVTYHEARSDDHSRFISPAIVAPEIVDVEVPKDDGVIRRGLMVVAKIIQNLANNIFFGKEAHMIVLNDFLSDNIVNVTRFLSELNVCLAPLCIPLFSHTEAL